MREIKFRVWLIKEQKLVRVLRIDFQTRQVVYETTNPFGEHGWATAYFNEIILEQYTGLKDKSGKEIYEGDILSFVYRPTRETKENYRGVIKFGNPNGAYNWGWQIRFIGTQPLTAKDILFWIEDIYTDCEVIGNIHENAELLKDETK